MKKNTWLSMRVLVMAIFLFLVTGIGNSAWSRTWCDDGEEFEDNRLFASVMRCLEREVHETTIEAITGFYTPFSQYVTTFLVLAMMIYGANTMLNSSERLVKDSTQFLLKLAFVIYFMQPDNAIWMYEQMDQILKGTTTQVSALASPNVPLACPVNVTMNSETTEALWQRADCIVNLLIGLNSADDANDGLSKGMMAFFYQNLSSGAIGVLIGIVGLYIAFNMLLALFRAAYTYVAAVIMVGFLFMIGLLFVPLIMLGKTFDYFRIWFKNILTFILQPVILFLYLNILLTAFDIMLYSGSQSIVSLVTGGASSGEEFQQYAEDNLYQECSKGFTHDARQTNLDIEELREDGGLIGNVPYTDQKPNPQRNPSELRIDVRYKCIDYEKIEGGSGALAGAVLLVGLSSFVMVNFLQVLPGIIQELSGGRSIVTDIIAGSNNMALPFSRQVQSIGTGMNNLMSSNVSRLLGGR